VEANPGERSINVLPEGESIIQNPPPQGVLLKGNKNSNDDKIETSIFSSCKFAIKRIIPVFSPSAAKAGKTEPLFCINCQKVASELRSEHPNQSNRLLPICITEIWKNLYGVINDAEYCKS
jgi:hypothetical protein